jgi:succinate dehydrogenase / fumarate reductase, flavoprotein subunit
MTNLLVTDVLVVGEGCAGQTAALAASVEGRKAVMLGGGRPPSTVVSPGFLTFAAHDGFTRDVFEAMSQVTGQGMAQRFAVSSARSAIRSTYVSKAPFPLVKETTP